jgi:opacity protein-like surface antigen
VPARSDRRRATGIAAVVAVVLLALAASASADGLDYVVAVEAGPAWFFLNDDRIEQVRMDPQWTAGGSFAFVSDFEWARNFAFELRYHRAQGSGEFRARGATQTFDMASDRAFFNVSYYFGGAVYDPFISGGVGTGHFVYTGRTGSATRGQVEEWDFGLNLGGGIDFKLLPVLTFGARIEYAFFVPHEFVTGFVSGLAPSLRIGVRF